MEELLGMILDRIGLDLKSMSWRRRIFVVAIYAIFGMILTLGGLYTLITHFDDALAIVGALCVVLGALYLVRITINLLAVLRE